VHKRIIKVNPLQLKTRVFKTSIMPFVSNKNILGYFVSLTNLNLYCSSSPLNSDYLCAQKQKISKTRFVIGISARNFYMQGLTYRIANFSQFGVSAEWKTFTLLPSECIGGNK
jgi:hypothetical protein